MSGVLLGTIDESIPGLGPDLPVLALGLVAGSLLLGVLCAWACAHIADDKGYGSMLFGVLGFFFSLITLGVVLVLPSRTST